MKIEMPGQMKGAECRSVTGVAIGLRRELETLFAKVTRPGISEVCFILRLGGSLGEFEELEIPTYMDSGTLIYDVVIRSHEWDSCSERQVRDILCAHLRPLVSDCLDRLDVQRSVAQEVLELIR